MNDATGMAGYLITDRAPRITIDPEADTIANFDWYTAMKNGTLQDMSWVIGGTANNKATVKVGAALGSQAQIVANSYGSRDGLTSFPTTILATISSGSDDISFLFD